MRTSVLLLSLAVIAAGGPASALDVAGSEPARSCPQHGPGFVELPGTTTCVRLSGRVRSEVTAAGRRHEPRTAAALRSSGLITIESVTDTPYGPFRAVARVRAGQTTALGSGPGLR